MSSMPLRYRISSWYQLPKCLSNNSKDLRLHVADYHNNNNVIGLRISVEHPEYGVLFAYILKARGLYVTENDDAELSTDEIFKQLEKFGFCIQYTNMPAMTVEQVEYLMTLDKLKFDKLRLLPVRQSIVENSPVTIYPVVFNSVSNPLWLQNTYSPTLKQFEAALVDGGALNLSKASEFFQFNWKWLDYVANIKDLLNDLSADPSKVGG